MDINASIEVVEIPASIEVLHLSASLDVVEVLASIDTVEISAPSQNLEISATIAPIEINVMLGTVGPKGADGVGGEEDVPYDRETDHVEVSATENHFYKGEADPGALTSDPVWRIFRRKVLEVGDEADVSDKYADGSALFTKVWDDRASYTY
ncbi:MAG: hypothetical protein GQ570_03990 [Helicobacteraceae bacterium]|nr:hypothetical protein [Helicobacteraceae bacterium]